MADDTNKTTDETLQGGSLSLLYSDNILENIKYILPDIDNEWGYAGMSPINKYQISETFRRFGDELKKIVDEILIYKRHKDSVSKSDVAFWGLSGNANLAWNLRKYEDYLYTGKRVYDFINKYILGDDRIRLTDEKKLKELYSDIRPYQPIRDCGYFTDNNGFKHDYESAVGILSQLTIHCVEFNELMTSARNSLGIAFHDKDTDLQINRLLIESKNAIDTMVGEELDYNTNKYGQRELLINRVRYAWNNSLEDFDLNFLPVILRMQLMVAADKVKGDSSEK